MLRCAQMSGAASGRDWMFCPTSGYLLEVRPAQGAAVCEASGFARDLNDLAKVWPVTAIYFLVR